jgi:hypothetical protein
MGWMTRAAALLAAGALCACGGGGGGSSGPPEFAISSDTVTFTAAQNGTPPPPQTVTVSAVSGTTFIGISQFTGLPFFSTFALTTETTGTITITPLSSTTAGVHTGVITVRGCSVAACVSGDVPGSPKTITVTYTVVPASTVAVAPIFLNFATGQGASPDTQSIALTTSTGATAWTSQIQYTTGSDWLDVPSMGAFPANVNVSVNSALLPAGTYAASVTFTSGIVSTAVPVTLSVNASGVNFVAPYVATTNVVGSVIIRGHGFTGATAVRFGADPATSVSVISDTEIHADHAAIPTAGAYAVEVDAGGVTLPTRANLVAVAAPNYAAAIVARPTTSTIPSHLIYDAERASVYLLDRDEDRIDRYHFDGLGWMQDSLPFVSTTPGNWSMALAPDGTVLLKTATGGINRVNPATLVVTGFTPTTGALGGDNLGPIAFANDGHAIGTIFASPTNVYKYHMLTQALTPLSTDAKSGQRDAVAPDNGSKVILSFTPTDLGGVPILAYNASSGALAPVAASTTESNRVTLSRTGAKAVVITNAIPSTARVYDASFAVLGDLPTSIGRVAFAPDERFVYCFDVGTRQVRKFDLDTSNGMGGFSEVGIGTGTPGTPGLGTPQMVVSPDGSTLFLAGFQNLVVMPAP